MLSYLGKFDIFNLLFFCYCIQIDFISKINVKLNILTKSQKTVNYVVVSKL